MAGLILSDKYKAFLKCDAPVEFLEGTTFAGKTTVGLFKYMLKVAASPKKLHIIASEDTGTAEKNLITKDLGILDVFGRLTEYNGNGSSEIKIPHIVFHTNRGDKIILVMGYGDRKRWKKALGGQYGCLLIDEINTADIEFVREASMRCDYLMGTLNPDDPSLPVYKEYINHSRPLQEYAADAPAELNRQLNEEPKLGWVHWFFSFEHNLGALPEKIAQIKMNTPKGTKLWKNKILGLRGRSTGLVFGIFDETRHVLTRQQAKAFIRDDLNREQKEWFTIFTAGMDTSYSQKSPDTIAMSFAGITNRGRYVLLEEKVYNNAALSLPLAPSDTVVNFVAFLERCRKEWGFARNTFVDSSDQATLMEFDKYRRAHRECMYIFNDAYKRVTIIDRINLQLGWMAYDDEGGKVPDFYVVENCTNYIGEMGTYSWKEDKDNQPEDGHDHMINSTQYGWIPYRDKIGVR